MYNYDLYLNTYIKDQNINLKDHIKVKSKYKIKEVRIKDEVTDNGLKAKLEFIKESEPISDYYNPQIKERWDKLEPYDKENLIKSGIIKEDDIKDNNLKILINYNY